MEKQDNTLIIRINKDLLETFNQVCAESCINRSELIRFWIEKFIEEKRDEKEC